MSAIVLTGAGLSACGLAEDSGAGKNGADLRVTNCGRPVHFDGTPERVVALGPSEVTTLVAAGAAGKIVARDDAGEKSAPYPPSIRAAVRGVPQIGTQGDLTREVLVDAQPDLVVGSVTQTITPASLSAVHIPLLSLRGNCGSNHAPGSSDGTADFADVTSDVRTLGRVLDTSPAASRSVSDMQRRVAAAKRRIDLDGASTATIIVFENNLEIYGRRSMAHTQFAELGARDSFADVDQRVFQGSVEELIKRDPSVIMLLSYGQSDAAARQAFLRLPGADRLAAVRRGAVFVQPYEYSSQGVLAVNGLENMARNLRPETAR